MFHPPDISWTTRRVFVFTRSRVVFRSDILAVSIHHPIDLRRSGRPDVLLCLERKKSRKKTRARGCRNITKLNAMRTMKVSGPAFGKGKKTAPGLFPFRGPEYPDPGVRRTAGSGGIRICAIEDREDIAKPGEAECVPGACRLPCLHPKPNSRCNRHRAAERAFSFIPGRRA